MQCNSHLSWQLCCIRLRISLSWGTDPPMTARHDDQRRILVERNIVLRMQLATVGALFTQLTLLFLRIQIWSDIVSMPAELKVSLAGGTDEEVEEFHNEHSVAIGCVRLTYQLFDDVEEGIREIKFGERVAPWYGRV